MDAQRAILNELMGSARNLTEEERKGYKEITWDDKELCGAYMIRFCPHDLFVNIQSDLGDFEKSPKHDAYVPKFEAKLAQFCEKLVMDLDRRVRHGRECLSQEVEPTTPPPLSAKKSEQLSVLKEKIKNLLEQVETLGEVGKVDEAEAFMRKVDAFNAKKVVLTQQSQNDKVLMLAQEKKMALCEICGSFLTAKEKAREEERLAKEKEAEKRRKQREKEHESKRRSGSSDRERYRDRDRERDRDKYRERDYDRWYGIYIFNT
ncbi:hypothetical protein UlMin_042176 [Ulmus minor]